MDAKQSKQRPAVLITGVSTGIGFDTARELIAHGFRILGSVRKIEDGTRVKDALGEHFTSLLFDVTHAEAIARAVTQAFLPLLGARKNCPHPPGRIVNLSSISGGVAFPLVGAYACSKHALEAM